MLLLLFVWALIGGADASPATSAKLCRDLLLDVPQLSPRTRDAWTKFRDRARRLATEVEAPWQSADLIAHLKYVLPTEHAGRRLAALPLTATERQVLCYALTPFLLETKLVAHDANLVVHLIDQLCGSSSTDAYAVTEGGLPLVDDIGEYAYDHVFDGGRASPSSPVRRELHRWLDHALVRLTPDDWRSLGAHARPSHLLPVLAAVGGSWAKLGLAEHDHARLAERLLADDRTLDVVTTWTGLTLDQLKSQVADASPLQWLEHRYRTGTLDAGAVATFETRAALYQGPARARGPRAEVTDLLFTLLYDLSVPYDVATRVITAADAYWPRRYGVNLPRLKFTERPLNDEQLLRAERFFGRFSVRPTLVHREKRRAARGIGLTLAYSGYGTPAEFIERAALHRHFTLPKRTPGHDAIDPVDAVHVHAAAEVYVKSLRHELPKFFRLRPAPTYAQLRWLIEAPGQFDPWPVAFDQDDRGTWAKLTEFPDEHYDTAPHARALVREVLDHGLPRVTNAAEWTELVTARLPRGRDLPSEFVAAVDRHVERIVRVGDPALNWLDAVADNPWLGLSRRLPALLRLRKARARHLRTDDLLSAVAVDRILTLADQHADRGKVSERRALWIYLAGRSAAGAVSFVDAARVRRLRAVAFDAGYRLDELASDFRGTSFHVEARDACK